MPTNPVDLTTKTEPSPPLPLGVSSEEYREYVAAVILRYASNGGELDLPQVYHRVRQITGRGYSTIKGWLHLGIGIPDLEAMARICASLRIPPAEIFPPNLLSGIVPSAEEPARADSSLALLPDVIPLTGRNVTESARRALARYAIPGATLVLLQQVGGDATGVIESGELMLVNTSVETISCAGVYVLRMPGSTGQMCTRMVQPLVGKPAALVSLVGNRMQGQAEELPMNGTEFVGGVSVLGHVVAVLRGL